MRVDVITTKRTFNFRDLTEAEGLILRTLLNMNDNGLLQSLKGDNPGKSNGVKSQVFSPVFKLSIDLARWAPQAHAASVPSFGGSASFLLPDWRDQSHPQPTSAQSR